ncbi:hypothetical protein X777_10996 [Ooceraea biroi]|uniref:Uncharacterized protein n=1 Tax=Ooceraea biroi TaxID=2015173 RepID=A0A026W3I5_OOCBI|nr:hypothetical protein X777_10996 [Ooceraea biroi]
MEFESDGEASDATDGDDSDFADKQMDICVDPKKTSDKTAPDNASQSNNDNIENSDFRDKMHRVIPIELNKRIL